MMVQWVRRQPLSDKRIYQGRDAHEEMKKYVDSLTTYSREVSSGSESSWSDEEMGPLTGHYQVGGCNQSGNVL